MRRSTIRLIAGFLVFAMIAGIVFAIFGGSADGLTRPASLDLQLSRGAE